MPRITRVANVVRHRVQSGETLETVAAQHGLSWEDVARFNWDTVDPDAVNDRLRTEVGANRLASGSRFLAFSSGDDPGVILIPREWTERGLITDRPNTVRVRSVGAGPNLIRCFAWPGRVYTYGKSFLHPEVAGYVEYLLTAVAQHPAGKLMVFAHADRCGSCEDNKSLSDCRARSAHALVTHETPVWEELYQQERWGVRAVQEMLAAVGHDPGGIDGRLGFRTEGAMRGLLGLPQQAHVSNNEAFRRRLFDAYMNTMVPAPIPRERFAPPAFMGCGELNPLVAPNANERAGGGRGRSPGNPTNRRVVFYLFRHAPTDVPCKHSDVGPCERQKQEHPEDRRHLQFSCRFYDRISRRCGCEKEQRRLATLRIRLFDEQLRPIGRASYEVCLTEERRVGTADEAGWLVEHDVSVGETCVVRWTRPNGAEQETGTESVTDANEDGAPEGTGGGSGPDTDAPAHTYTVAREFGYVDYERYLEAHRDRPLTVSAESTGAQSSSAGSSTGEAAYAEERDYEFEREVYVDYDTGDDQESTRRRLSNFGFDRAATNDQKIADFSDAYRNKEEITRDKITQWHDAADPREIPAEGPPQE